MPTQYTLDEILASDQVPSLPEVALRIIEIAQQPDPDTQELIRTVRTDPAIAGRILKFANSALFGLRHRPSSIEAAVPMLGTTLVRTLTLGFSLARQTPASEGLKPWFRQLWRETLFQASAAEYFAEKTEGADPPTWFLAGLLQDIGQLAMLNVAQVEYYRHVLDAGTEKSRLSLELEHFGFSHVDVSVSLCRKWNLERDIVTAIAGHHETDNVITPERRTTLQFGLKAATCCADYMDAVSTRLESTRSDVERHLIDGFGCLPHEVPELLAEMDARAVQLAGGFAVDVGNLPSRERILARAQRVLRDIALDSQLKNVTGVGKLATGNDDEFTDRSEWKEWLDESLSTYNRRFLDKALPQELKRCHNDGAVVGLLKVDFSAAVPADEDNTEKPVETVELLELIKESVRPTDSVVCTGNTTAILILPGLNYDVLSGIAARIQNQLNERLDLLAEDEAAPSVGGVVVVPAGRTAATPNHVLDLLEESSDKARQLTSSRIAFLLLMGKKAKPIGAAS